MAAAVAISPAQTCNYLAILCALSARRLAQPRWAAPWPVLAAVLPTKTAEAAHLAAAEHTTEMVPAQVEAETEAILFLRDLEFLTLIAPAAAQAAFMHRVVTTATEVQVAATGAMAAIPNAFRLALLLAALAEQKAAALVEARYLVISLQMPDITLHFMAVAVAAADRQETNLALAPVLVAAAIRA